MTSERIHIRCSIQLLVEGKDAQNFFKAFVGRLSLHDVDVQDFGGVGEFRQFLAAFVTAPNFGNVRSIGVVRDAEQSADAALQRVQRRDKARAHAWLATQPLPHVSVGVAALRGYWNLDHQALDAARQFLTAL